MASLSGQMVILLLDTMGTSNISRCISSIISSSNSISSSSSSLTTHSSRWRTTPTTLTPKNTCPRGTGLPTLQMVTSMQCQANLAND